ncbi:MAG: SPFH domain-containing protein [Prolixibacteraceae bacterium]|jgi:regulator of protease activity HflC (stomatin/prohibitin superfamily)|nr:SPFH domain-containing protein [Prolixibacteraceae bacterium]MBT6005459.1 SPFH domain-containing protein [Prolixibacteraceae bacterium]MBT6765713.1 SPFH domain-containing protein [Prolixibacteraceae bacterium]MBT6999911.1 SPFH domain-containing protein [Prolixibacteraceae bacterium]MBT7393243.1 SPFH domain-containing protein [Prolixibacteraceae bacterium]
MEKQYKGLGGYLFLFLELIVLAIIVFGFMRGMVVSSIILIPIFILIAIGFTVVDPNQSCVMVLFGAYKGTIKINGFYWVNPFFVKKKISLRARNFDSETIKVNDKLGNPIMIGLVLVWKVEETFKAAFGVDEYEHFVVVQSEAALRKLAGLYAYDNIEDETAKVTLRDGTEEVNNELEREIVERLDIAGIHVVEARINHIAYAQEIAQAMLKRQQATAIVAARFKIVEGAVSMVEMALEQLSEKNIVDLDDDKKATMVSNLMVVLCGDKDATPIVNTGTLY